MSERKTFSREQMVKAYIQVNAAPKEMKDKLGMEHVSDYAIRPVACEKTPFFIAKEHRYQFENKS